MLYLFLRVVFECSYHIHSTCLRSNDMKCKMQFEQCLYSFDAGCYKTFKVADKSFNSESGRYFIFSERPLHDTFFFTATNKCVLKTKQKPSTDRSCGKVLKEESKRQYLFFGTPLLERHFYEDLISERKRSYLHYIKL